MYRSWEIIRDDAAHPRFWRSRPTFNERWQSQRTPLSATPILHWVLAELYLLRQSQHQPLTPGNVYPPHVIFAGRVPTAQSRSVSL
eukprot:scaffold258424_cov37-Tisochrysis_lutea.AAC.2